MITNQQATASHTAKMFNRSRTQWMDGNPVNEPIMTLDNYYERIVKPTVEKYERKIKMTRKEAIEKLQDNDVYRGAYANQFVAALEALGLIKFDEKLILDETMDEAITKARHCAMNSQKFIDCLNEYGYKIVKTGVF